MNGGTKSSTNPAEAVGKIVLELNEKLTGISFRVPTTNISVIKPTAHLKNSADY